MPLPVTKLPPLPLPHSCSRWGGFCSLKWSSPQYEIVIVLQSIWSGPRHCSPRFECIQTWCVVCMWWWLPVWKVSCNSAGGGTARRTNEMPRQWGQRVVANNVRQNKWQKNKQIYCFLISKYHHFFFPPVKQNLQFSYISWHQPFPNHDTATSILQSIFNSK